jgi:hypothetical protein
MSFFVCIDEDDYLFYFELFFYNPIVTMSILSIKLKKYIPMAMRIVNRVMARPMPYTIVYIFVAASLLT